MNRMLGCCLGRDEKTNLYDATPGVGMTSGIAASFLGLQPENVRVIAPFVGVVSGSKGLWLHTLRCAMAAKATVPGQLALTRQMMQTNGVIVPPPSSGCVGHRCQWETKCDSSPQ